MDAQRPILAAELGSLVTCEGSTQLRIMPTHTELPPLKNKPAARKPVKQGHLMSVFLPPIHGTVSTFCNWTEDNCCCFSVSGLYREIASIRSVPGKRKSSVKDHVSNTSDANSSVLSRLSLMNHSRIFPQDRKSLTRGEKNIIEGICSNKRRNIRAQICFGKSQTWDKEKQESSGFVKSVRHNPPFVIPVIKGEKICGSSFMTGRLKDFRETDVSLYCDSYISCSNSSQQLSSSSELSLLSWDSKVKYVTPNSSDSTHISSQQIHHETNEETKEEVRVKTIDELSDVIPSTPSNTTDRVKQCRNGDYSDCLEFPLCLHALVRTKSNSNRKKICTDISVHNKSTANNMSSVSLHSTKVPLLRVQNTKQNRSRRHASLPTRRFEESEFDVVELDKNNGSCVRKNCADREQIEDKTTSGETNRKVEVKVYLPVTERETTWEGGASTPTSARKLYLIKERPLSPTEFEERYKGKSAVDVDLTFHNRQSSITLKEVF